MQFEELYILGNKAEQEELLLGIDYGEARIGLAFGREGHTVPIKVVPAKSTLFAISEILKVIAANKITKIIIGIPIGVEGKELPISLKIRRFGNLLKVKSKRPVEYINEHFSTKESMLSALDTGVPQKKRRKIDHISAAIILKNYYEN